MKRNAFYVGSDVWNSALGSKSKLVFTYLSRCANAAGECFPSVKSIAEGCAVSKSTVKRALRELEASGAITVEERYVRYMGGRRRTTNIYRIPVTLAQKAPASEKEAGEERTPPERLSDHLFDEEDRLQALIERLCIKSWEDDDLRRMTILTLSEMWHKPFIVIGGESIPNGAVRHRLEMLTGDAVWNAVEALRRIDVKKPVGYFMSCLYNAPLETAAKISAFRRKLDEYGTHSAGEFMI